MNRLFRKYHRQIAIIMCLPLFLTILTGMGYTIAHEWLHQNELGEFLLPVHTLEILHLDTIYTLMNGLGLIGLLVTGFSMMGLFRKRPAS